MHRTKTWWLYLVLALGCGVVIADQLLPTHTEVVSIVQLDYHTERAGKRNRVRTEVINAHMLHLSDGKVLQLSPTNDWLATGDTIELQRTRILSEPVQFRKKCSRIREWQVVDSNKSDHRLFPYIVGFLAFLLLFPWPEGNWRWSLTAALIFVLFGWFMMLMGTGGLARFYQWF